MPHNQANLKLQEI